MGARRSRFGSHVLASIDDIERLRSSMLRLLHLEERIELQIPGLDPRLREHHQARLNELAGICGCAESSGVGALALICMIVWWIRNDVAINFGSIAAALATLIGVMLTAKFLRVLVARLQLRAALGRILSQQGGLA
jgi:hypothetical protein